MLNGLIGFLAGYIAFTESGHEIGNKAMKTISEQAKKVLKNDTSENTNAEPTNNAEGDNSHID